MTLYYNWISVKCSAGAPAARICQHYSPAAPFVVSNILAFVAGALLLLA
jgi:hypothetical protein